ncbi:MAG: hypothetical protein AB7G11_15310 [Phycisphaerales bacterium]
MSYRALCSDFYVNQRVALKMDLPMRRDTVLAMFDRVRREHPWMERFRRYQHELSLESRTPAGGDTQQQWLALRKSSVRSGSVNPESPEDAFRLHRLVLEISPYFLDISALDIDYVELLFGFDLTAMGNHDAMAFNALLRSSPLAHFADAPGSIVLECAPVLGIALDEGCTLQAQVEVKTRSSARQVKTGEYREEPLSIYLTVRKYGPIDDIKDLAKLQSMLIEQAEELIASRVVPHVLMPLRDIIASG